MSTDRIRALCAELAEAVLSDDSHIDCAEIARRARAALAEPADGPAAGAGQPSDEELLCMAARAIEPYDTIKPGEYEPDTVCAVEAYGSELCAFARDVLARWGNHSPDATKMVPAAEGEVAELVAWLHGQDGGMGRRAIYARIAQLLERQAAPVPGPVSERLPGPEDCDEEGYCWRWNMIAGSWARQPISRRWYEFESHWLPAHDLPLPAQVGEVEP